MMRAALAVVASLVAAWLAIAAGELTRPAPRTPFVDAAAAHAASCPAMCQVLAENFTVSKTAAAGLPPEEASPVTTETRALRGIRTNGGTLVWWSSDPFTHSVALLGEGPLTKDDPLPAVRAIHPKLHGLTPQFGVLKNGFVMTTASSCGGADPASTCQHHDRLVILDEHLSIAAERDISPSPWAEPVSDYWARPSREYWSADDSGGFYALAFVPGIAGWRPRPARLGAYHVGRDLTDLEPPKFFDEIASSGQALDGRLAQVGVGPNIHCLELEYAEVHRSSFEYAGKRTFLVLGKDLQPLVSAPLFESRPYLLLAGAALSIAVLVAGALSALRASKLRGVLADRPLEGELTDVSAESITVRTANGLLTLPRNRLLRFVGWGRVPMQLREGPCTLAAHRKPVGSTAVYRDEKLGFEGIPVDVVRSTAADGIRLVEHRVRWSVVFSLAGSAVVTLVALAVSASN